MPMRGAWDALHDVDNRLKTIFDALRTAKGPNELGAGPRKECNGPHQTKTHFCRYERRVKSKNAKRFQSVRDFVEVRGTLRVLWRGPAVSQLRVNQQSSRIEHTAPVKRLR